MQTDTVEISRSRVSRPLADPEGAAVQAAALEIHASRPEPAAALWDAVLRRDASQDGAFVYAVRSTGIYCRPSCPSRRPRREHVSFFPRPAEAERAGFRPCRRCRPDDTPPAASVEQELTLRACAVIQAAGEQPLTLAALGAQLGYSPAHVQRVFQRVLGVTPRQYAEARRLERFKAEVKEGATVTEALYEAGYGSSSRLYEGADARLGMTPGIYKQGGKGQRIAYTVAASPLGLLLVAATARGVCAVAMGDDEAVLARELRREYPAAAVERDNDALQEWVEAVLRYLEGKQRSVEVPLDVQATSFRWRVWRALQAIPYGATRTYGELARDLGCPGAARAVGRACATNPVSLIVPCHRAIGASGQLTGYRWGVERKRQLLEQERQGATGGGGA